MKITTSQLKKIIAEEFSKVVNEMSDDEENTDLEEGTPPPLPAAATPQTNRVNQLQSKQANLQKTLAGYQKAIASGNVQAAIQAADILLKDTQALAVNAPKPVPVSENKKKPLATKKPVSSKK